MRRGHTPGRLGLNRYLAIAVLATALLFLSAGTALAASHSISGTVKQAGTGIPNVWVEAYDANGNDLGVHASTGDGGVYTLVMDGGIYKVAIWVGEDYVNEWYQDDPFQVDQTGTGATPVNIESQDASGINFVLTPAHTISGRELLFTGSAPSLQEYCWPSSLLG